jgi:hypothetical protein
MVKQSGVYEFRTLYKKESIQSSLSSLTVIPDEASFHLSDLSIYQDG